MAVGSRADIARDTPDVRISMQPARQLFPVSSMGILTFPWFFFVGWQTISICRTG